MFFFLGMALLAVGGFVSGVGFNNSRVQSQRMRALANEEPEPTEIVKVVCRSLGEDTGWKPIGNAEAHATYFNDSINIGFVLPDSSQKTAFVYRCDQNQAVVIYEPRFYEVSAIRNALLARETNELATRRFVLCQNEVLGLLEG